MSLQVRTSRCKESEGADLKSLAPRHWKRAKAVVQVRVPLMFLEPFAETAPHYVSRDACVDEFALILVFKHRGNSALPWSSRPRGGDAGL